MAKKDYKKILKDKKLEAGKLMTEAHFKKCSAAIHTASVTSAVSGAIPIPVADAVPITAAQITMERFSTRKSQTLRQKVLSVLPPPPLLGETS